MSSDIWGSFVMRVLFLNKQEDVLDGKEKKEKEKEVL